MHFLEEKNRFYQKDIHGNLISEVTFTDDGSTLILDHTFVDSTYRGQGIAGKLVALVVEKARKEGKKIIPLCSFAKKEFERKPEYQYVKK